MEKKSQNQCLQNRRQFIKSVALSTAAVAVPFYVPGKLLGMNGAVPPSEQILLGAFGIGNRGMHCLDVFMSNPDVRFVSICDVRRSRREEIKRMADERYGNNDCTMFRDLFEFYDANPAMDAVLIATGDRWHTMASIVAAKAGKDIFCEKPLSLTIQESRAVEVAVNRYGRVFQAGTQRRNGGNFEIAARLAHEGKLGKLTEVHANTLSPGTTHDWLPGQPEPDPNDVDWNLWLGPVPWRPFNEQYVRGGWHGFFDLHGGGILEWGTHTVDLCQWANQSDETVPIEYWATYNANGDKTSRVEARYENGVKLVMRDNGWLGLGSCAVRYVGEEGWVETGDSGRSEVSSDALRRELRFFGAGYGAEGHVREFLDCVKSRKKPSCNADVAAMAHIACHCAKIAWDLSPARKSASEEGIVLNFDPVKEEFVGTGSDVDAANRLRSRAMRSPWRV